MAQAQVSLVVNLDFPSVYRGLRIALEQGVWRVTAKVPGHVSGPCFAEVGYIDSSIEPNLQSLIDTKWERILQVVAQMNLVSVDEIPWAIHSLEDPRQREIAAKAFLTEKV